MGLWSFFKKKKHVRAVNLDEATEGRHRDTRFTPLEKEAVNLISSFIDGSISVVDFSNSFHDVRKRFMEMMTIDGIVTFDKDTPLWLNSFIGFKFLKWYKFQLLKRHFELHPEELVGATKEQYEDILEIGYDEKFRQACIEVLNMVHPTNA